MGMIGRTELCPHGKREKMLYGKSRRIGSNLSIPS